MNTLDNKLENELKEKINFYVQERVQDNILNIIYNLYPENFIYIPQGVIQLNREDSSQGIYKSIDNLIPQEDFPLYNMDFTWQIINKELILTFCTYKNALHFNPFEQITYPKLDKVYIFTNIEGMNDIFGSNYHQGEYPSLFNFFNDDLFYFTIDNLEKINTNIWRKKILLYNSFSNLILYTNCIKLKTAYKNLIHINIEREKQILPKILNIQNIYYEKNLIPSIRENAQGWYINKFNKDLYLISNLSQKEVTLEVINESLWDNDIYHNGKKYSWLSDPKNVKNPKFNTNNILKTLYDKTISWDQWLDLYNYHLPINKINYRYDIIRDQGILREQKIDVIYTSSKNFFLHKTLEKLLGNVEFIYETI